MGMFEDFRLKVFIAVAQEGGFTKAADVLGVTQPAVSQNISELEKGLGFPLFRRLHKEVVLTPQGEVFLKHARRMLSIGAETERFFSPLDVTEVRISASDEIYAGFILPALCDFITAHPEIQVRRSDAEDCDIQVAVRPSDAKPGLSSLELVYIPKQAFAFTKTCMVLKEILHF